MTLKVGKKNIQIQQNRSSLKPTLSPNPQKHYLVIYPIKLKSALNI